MQVFDDKTFDAPPEVEDAPTFEKQEFEAAGEAAGPEEAAGAEPEPTAAEVEGGKTDEEQE